MAENRRQLDTELRDARARDRAFGDAASRVMAAEKQLADLDAAVAQRADELRVVDDAVAEVEREVERHAREHAAALRKEVGADAEKAAARLAAAIKEITRAHAEYVVAGTRSVELQRIIDRDQLRTMRIPDVAVEVSGFARHAPEYARGIRIPVLIGPDMVTVTELQPPTVEAQAEAAA